jgi:hypothetical protein
MQDKLEAPKTDNGAADAVAAVVLIAIFVCVAVFWISGH